MTCHSLPFSSSHPLSSLVFAGLALSIVECLVSVVGVAGENDHLEKLGWFPGLRSAKGSKKDPEQRKKLICVDSDRDHHPS